MREVLFMQIVDKVLTMEDVQVLNASKNASVVLKNTVGQSVDVIKHLAPNVSIQIIGGYDSEKKPKYNELRIQRRTFYTPSEVCDIISSFEKYEEGIDNSWTDLEKATYLYKKFAETIVYEEDNGKRSRNLNTVLGKGVCAGYASVFKEAMDRQGIECDIINEPRVHSWNAIKFDDKWYSLDLTWDANNIQNKGINNLVWFGQNPNFNKVKYHNACGEGIVANNCFEPQVIADILNKIEHTDEYQPIKQKEKVEPIFANAFNLASQGDSVDEIMADVGKVAEYAFSVGKSFRDEAYTEEFDQKFADIFKALKLNENLTDEQKSILLSRTNALWADVMGGKYLGGIQNSIKSGIRGSLREMNLLLNDKDVYTIDYEFIKTQEEEIRKKCTSYGVVDFEKMEAMKEAIAQQVGAMRESKEQQQDIGNFDTQIKIDGPIQIIEVEPVLSNDERLKKWASHQIADIKTFLNGIEESGDNIEDAETKDIVSACQYQLNALLTNLSLEQQLDKEYVRGVV